MIKPRQEAIASGDTHYTGKPCRTCGNRIRYTCSAGCVECIKRRSSEDRERIRAIRERLAK